LVFVTADGEIVKKFRKKWEANEDGCLDKLMAYFSGLKEQTAVVEETLEETTEE
jgi:hypothetical protein